MNNMQIIMNEAIASGYFTEDEVIKMIESGEDIPFHTYAVWKNNGMVPKSGSHGWECKLWRKKCKKEGDEKEMDSEEVNKDFYLTKSFLFHISQVEELKKI